MSENKTTESSATSFVPSDGPVAVALDKATGPRRAEAEQLIHVLQEITGCPPVVWGTRIIGFGEYAYRYESGREGRGAELAFASSSSSHTFYLVEDFAELWPDLIERLGKHRVSKACLYVTRLRDVDFDVLRELLVRSLEYRRYGISAPN